MRTTKVQLVLEDKDAGIGFIEEKVNIVLERILSQVIGTRDLPCGAGMMAIQHNCSDEVSEISAVVRDDWDTTSHR